MRTFALALTLAVGLTCGLTACTPPNQVYREQGLALYNQAKAAEDGKDEATAAAKYGEALDAFDKALAYNHQDPAANAYKAAIKYREGKYEEAAYHAHVAMQFDPSNAEARTIMIASRIKQDKPDLALDALERLSGLADTVKDPRAEKGNWKRPYQKEIDERLYYSPVNNRYEIGRVYESLGDLDNAALWYNRAAEKAPDSRVVRVALVKLYDRAGNRPKLMEAAASAYAIDPANPELVTIMTRNRIAISDISRPR